MNNIKLSAPKNEARTNQINTAVAAEATAFIRSPRIRRWVIREFNFVTSRLYLSVNSARGRRTNKKERLNELLGDLVGAVEMLEADTEYYEGEINEAVFPGETYTLRIISPFAATIYRLLVRADVACTKLYMSEFNGKLDHDKRELLLEPVTQALLGIKQFSIGHIPKTAAQMAEELEIG
ncbi:hypothetical protein [Burkholderia sp. Ac-20365]|uniref:hypothetical protein n=1 Tax=Burkholderia sp. Ac-20365 TaxID=2703897 RepID=UPI00197BB30D|nr:hypothetical protein [Burkholderia sp. Ac-20365]MBN3760959.1 hypothetical protein [Burkholderia sp. Ac-20365]